MVANDDSQPFDNQRTTPGVSIIVACTIVVLGALGVLAIGGKFDQSDQIVAEAINVREINVTDKNGDVRVRVTATESGAELKFLGSNGKRRIMMSVDEHGSAFTLYDHSGEPRVGMAGGENDSELILFGKGRAPVIHMQRRDLEDNAVIGLFDSNRGPRLVVGTSPGDTSVAIHDEQGKVRAVLGTTSEPRNPRSESSVSLFSETGEVIWESPN